MTFCFDIDDTISRHINRDYENAIPKEDVIVRMRQLKELFPTCSIILNTARGMKSCGGDRIAAESKNRPILEAWLKKHHVPYDEIVFGKPFADVYVDDKNVNILDFVSNPINVFNGFSGAVVLRVGNIIIKQSDNAGQQASWYRICKNVLPSVNLPVVFSSSFGKLYIQYIDGNKLSLKRVPPITLRDAISILRKFSNIPHDGNNMEAYADYIRSRAAGCVDVEPLLRKFADCKTLQIGTFSHGDYSLSNLIDYNGRIYIIDPSQKPFMSHWLVDAAKLRASLRGLDRILDPSAKDNTSIIPYYDSQFSQSELEVIHILEKTHYVRVMYFAKKFGMMDKVEQLKALYYD